MKKYLQSVLLPVVLLLLTVGLAGCQRQPDAREEGEESYQVYYLNTAMTRLIQREYHTKTTDSELLVQELMDTFLTVPADLDAQGAMSERVMYQGSRQEGNVLYLFFDNNYAVMGAEREILCRAALTRTLVQVPGIDYINIYCGDQPLMNADGVPVGMLSAADFVDNISDVNAYEEAQLTLYFTDESGELLYPEQRTVIHNVNTSLEQLIVEELISGPERADMKATLDPGTKLLNVSVNENVCYLNFDNTFLNNQLEVREYIPIYSIVNSLSELSSVNRVQLTVNGSQEVTFRDQIPFNTLFERNLDYIGGDR